MFHVLGIVSLFSDLWQVLDLAPLLSLLLLPSEEHQSIWNKQAKVSDNLPCNTLEYLHVFFIERFVSFHGGAHGQTFGAGRLTGDSVC